MCGAMALASRMTMTRSNFTANKVIRKHGNISGYERAMWREQERQEIEDRIEAFRAKSRAALTSDPDAWKNSAESIISLDPAKFIGSQPG